MRFIRRAVLLTIAAGAAALLLAALSAPSPATAITSGPLPSPITTPFVGPWDHTPVGNDWCVPLCGT
jgi:hypothetical protein